MKVTKILKSEIPPETSEDQIYNQIQEWKYDSGFYPDTLEPHNDKADALIYALFATIGKGEAWKLEFEDHVIMYLSNRDDTE